ncbi:MAG: hypothetical protein SGJ26_12910 [Nitrospirota bacterium]|nr:hypothetical protein [Nitrospirota bacterium]
MKWYQCANPAMYQVSDQNKPMCLDYYFKFVQIQQQEVESDERMFNYRREQMSATVGLPPMGPHFSPRPRPAVVAGAKLHNTSINNRVSALSIRLNWNS